MFSTVADIVIIMVAIIVTVGRVFEPDTFHCYWSYRMGKQKFKILSGRNLIRVVLVLNILPKNPSVPCEGDHGFMFQVSSLSEKDFNM